MLNARRSKVHVVLAIVGLALIAYLIVPLRIGARTNSSSSSEVGGGRSSDGDVPGLEAAGTRSVPAAPSSSEAPDASEAALTIRGSVRDEFGRRTLVGAVVVAAATGTLATGEPTHVLVGGAGRFEFVRPLSAYDEVDVWFESDDGKLRSQVVTREWTESGLASDVKLVALRAATVHATVVDDAGRPAAGAIVRSVLGAPVHPVSTTDTSGAAKLRVLPGHLGLIAKTTDGRLAKSELLYAEPGDTVAVRLVASIHPAHLAVRVVSDGHADLTGEEVVIACKGGLPTEWKRMHVGGEPALFRVVKDKPLQVSVAHRNTSVYTLRTVASARLLREQLEVVLGNHSRVEVVAVDKAGAPLAGLVARLEREAEARHKAVRGDLDSGAGIATGVDGRAVISAVGYGEYVLTVGTREQPGLERRVVQIAKSVTRLDVEIADRRAIGGEISGIPGDLRGRVRVHVEGVPGEARIIGVASSSAWASSVPADFDAEAIVRFRSSRWGLDHSESLLGGARRLDVKLPLANVWRLQVRLGDRVFLPEMTLQATPVGMDPRPRERYRAAVDLGTGSAILVGPPPGTYKMALLAGGVSRQRVVAQLQSVELEAESEPMPLAFPESSTRDRREERSQGR